MARATESMSSDSRTYEPCRISRQVSYREVVDLGFSHSSYEG